MELGESKIRRNGVNTLRNAVHPRHGLAWTDGSSVYLAPVSANAGQLENNHSRKLGEFNYVQSLHWSCSIKQCVERSISNGIATAATSNGISNAAASNAIPKGAASNGILEGAADDCVPDGTACRSEPASTDAVLAGDHEYCYLCVTHNGTVSLWKVDGQAPEMGLRQVRKINATPIPQGCLWNPVRDILCILHRDMCSLYFRHLENKGSYALPPIESGQIHCGCWSDDGSKLVVAIGSIVLIYQWQDIASCVSDFTIAAWKIPGLDGQVTTMVSANNNRVVCLAEMPLEQLCVTKDLFEMPDLQNVGRQTDDSDTLVKPAPDAMQSLLHLQTNRQLPVNDKSQLIVFEMTDGDVAARKLFSRKLSGALSPDLLHYDATSQSVVVACNSKNTLQVFRLSADQLTKTHEMILGKDERPKGLCGISASGFQDNQILMMVGSLHEPSNEFVSTSVMADYRMRLCCISVKQRKSEAIDHNVEGDIELHISEPSIAANATTKGRTSSLHVRWEEAESTPVKMPRRKRKKMHSTGLDITKLTGGLKLPPNIDALQLFDNSKLDALKLPDGSQLLADDAALRMFDETKFLPPKRQLIAELPAENYEMANGDDAASVPHLENAIQEQSAKIARLQQRIDEIQRLLTEVGGSGAVELANVITTVVKSATVQPPAEVDMNSNILTDQPVNATINMDTAPDASIASVTAQDMTENTDSRDVSRIQITEKMAEEMQDMKANSTQDIIEESMDKMTIVQSTEKAPTDDDNDMKDADILQVADDDDGASVQNVKNDPTVELVNEDVSWSTINVDSNSADGGPALEMVNRVHNTCADTVSRRDSAVGTTTDASAVDMSDSHMPQLLHLVLQVDNKTTEAAAVTKTFLLDNGRLRLDLVKQAFGLATVELLFDGLSCVVGCSPDGYIPMKFVPNGTMYLTGNKA